MSSTSKVLHIRWERGEGQSFIMFVTSFMNYLLKKLLRFYGIDLYLNVSWVSHDWSKVWVRVVEHFFVTGIFANRRVCHYDLQNHSTERRRLKPKEKKSFLDFEVKNIFLFVVLLSTKKSKQISNLRQKKMRSTGFQKPVRIKAPSCVF